MGEPTYKELDDSIKLLSAYRERLRTEVLKIGKKLQISPKKINSDIEKKNELAEIDMIIEKLISQRDN